MNRILVVRLGSLGDLVHTLPAVSAIHRTFPRLEIDWLVDAVHEEFLALVPILTSVVTLAAPTLDGWLDVRRRLRARKYDAALDFQGLVKSAALSRLSGATRVMGFDRASLREPAAAVLYRERVPVMTGGHVIQKNLGLVAAIGAQSATTGVPTAAAMCVGPVSPDTRSFAARESATRSVSCVRGASVAAPDDALTIARARSSSPGPHSAMDRNPC